MFLVNRLFGISGANPAQPELITIDGGQLFLVRSDGVKGSRECIFIDASIAIRRTGHDYTYQIVVTRTFQEGEDQLLDEDAENLDERAFLLDPSLHFTLSGPSFTWLDPDDDAFEFALPPAALLPSGDAAEFERLAWRCMWERRNRAPWPAAGSPEEAHAERTLEGDFRAPPPQAAVFRRQPKLPLFRAASEEPSDSDAASVSPRPVSDLDPSDDDDGDDDDDDIAAALGAVSLSASAPGVSKLSKPVSKAKDKGRATGKGQSHTRQRLRSPSPPSSGLLPTPQAVPLDSTLVAAAKGELHMYDRDLSYFVLQTAHARLELSSNPRGWWLAVYNDEKNTSIVSMDVAENPDISFQEASLSMPFNFLNTSSDPPELVTWLVRFPSLNVLHDVEDVVSQAIFEVKNGRGAWTRLKEDERTYNRAAWMQPMEGIEEEVAPQEEEEEEDEDESEEEDYEEESEEDERDRKPLGHKAKNSQLAVGYKEDLSFVVQGDMIGVFKQQRDGGKKLKFVTSIVNISTPDGKKGFVPKKVMLHNQDTSMILQNPLAPGSLYRLDLETGKVVDEYKVSEDFDVSSFLPDSKFAQMTQQQTFIGLSHNGLFRIDPRLAGSKLVDSEFKQYVTKNDFSVAATTEAGKLAVASNKGDIRLFDKLGKIAKTVLPALGDPILGIDSTADGRWILATTKTYLMLIDTLIPEGAGRYGGSSGFDRSFPADRKPTPKILQLKPEHVAHMQGVSFTPAKFNAGLNEQERTIVSSSGPFIIAWNFRHVKAGNINNYTIRRYSDNVIADQFKFGGDREIIVTLPGNVLVEEKKKLKAPTRDSISTIVNAWEP